MEVDITFKITITGLVWLFAVPRIKYLFRVGIRFFQTRKIFDISQPAIFFLNVLSFVVFIFFIFGIWHHGKFGGWLLAIGWTAFFVQALIYSCDDSRRDTHIISLASSSTLPTLSLVVLLGSALLTADSEQIKLTSEMADTQSQISDIQTEMVDVQAKVVNAQSDLSRNQRKIIMAIALILERSGTLSATEQTNLEHLIAEMDSQKRELSIPNPNS